MVGSAVFLFASVCLPRNAAFIQARAASAFPKARTPRSPPAEHQSKSRRNLEIRPSLEVGPNFCSDGKMSGRLFTYREGDRSEYLALYLLSSLGLVTQVPRQEDVGFDLVCSVADQETGFLTFRHQYLVSIKSVGRYAPIVMSPSRDWDADYPTHIHWLFELDLPLLLAVVDRRNNLLYLYSTLPAWFLRYGEHYQHCGKLTLKPRIRSRNAADIQVEPTRLEELKAHPGKYHYRVDLGHPMFSISTNDVSDPDTLKNLKQRLRLALKMADQTIRYAKAGAPYFYWFHETARDFSKYTPAFFCNSLPVDPAIHNRVLADISPILSSLALFYKATGQNEQLQTVGNVLRLAPPGCIPQPIIDFLPEIFQ